MTSFTRWSSKTGGKRMDWVVFVPPGASYEVGISVSFSSCSFSHTRDVLQHRAADKTVASDARLGGMPRRRAVCLLPRPKTGE